MASIAYLSLGSNLGDRKHQLDAAIAQLVQLGSVISVSAFYETEPVEFTDQPWFLNCAVGLETSMEPEHLLKHLMCIERDLGRNRAKEKKKGPRTIDIDILLFGDATVNFPALQIPHPAMHERRFVLEPLAEIAPEAQHPVLKKSVERLLADLPPGPEVRRMAESR